jgi:hypothetical protein
MDRAIRPQINRSRAGLLCSANCPRNVSLCDAGWCAAHVLILPEKQGIWND